MQDQQGTSHEGESRDTIAIIFYITGTYITRVSQSSISFQTDKSYYKPVASSHVYGSGI
jgi:hypothetical protein